MTSVKLIAQNDHIRNGKAKRFNKFVVKSFSREEMNAYPLSLEKLNKMKHLRSKKRVFILIMSLDP